MWVDLWFYNIKKRLSQVKKKTTKSFLRTTNPESKVKFRRKFQQLKPNFKYPSNEEHLKVFSHLKWIYYYTWVLRNISEYLKEHQRKQQRDLQFIFFFSSSLESLKNLCKIYFIHFNTFVWAVNKKKKWFYLNLLNKNKKFMNFEKKNLKKKRELVQDGH